MDFLKRRLSLTSDPEKDEEDTGSGSNVKTSFTATKASIWSGITSKLDKTSTSAESKSEKRQSFVDSVRQRFTKVRLYENGDTDSDEETDKRRAAKSRDYTLVDTSDTKSGASEPNALSECHEQIGSETNTTIPVNGKKKLGKRQDSFTAEEIYMETVAAGVRSGLMIPDSQTVMISPSKAVNEFVFASQDTSRKGKSLQVPNGNLINFDSCQNLAQVEPIVHREDDNGNDYVDYSSDSSSEPVYSGNQVRRSESFGSLISSEDLDEESRRTIEFAHNFAENIFAGNTNQTDEKQMFGRMVQDGSFRLQFARFISEKRVTNRKVEEHTFYLLVQYFALTLFECDEADDYTPALILMNMCFTFYYEAQRGGKMEKNYLYVFLKNQPIWHSMRYWNAAFFEAVQTERSKKPLTTNRANSDEESQDRRFQENVIFGQLGTFLHNMKEFGLNIEWCLEFLRKQATIGNLSEEQITMLRDNLEQK